MALYYLEQKYKSEIFIEQMDNEDVKTLMHTVLPYFRDYIITSAIDLTVVY